MENGFIKLWRQTLESEIMGDDWLFRLFFWCALKANWKDGRGKDAIKRGQFRTTKTLAADALRVTPSKLYRGLQKLKELGCIDMQVNQHQTIVTVCNYSTYQDANDDCEPPEPKDSEPQANQFKTVQPKDLQTDYDAERTASEPRANRERTAYPYREELEEREENTAPKMDNCQNSRAGEDHSPAWLASKWLFRRRGNKSRDELERARTTFEEMIRLGTQGAQIAAEIDSFNRRRTEPIWEFEERLLKRLGLWKRDKNGPTDNLAGFREAISDADFRDKADG